MKILLIIDDYLPYSTKVGAKMMHELAVHLKEIGHKITVLTPNPDQKSNLKIEILDEIKILYFKSGRIKNIGKIQRAINETLLSYKAFKYSKKYLIKNPHDGIIYYSPSIFFGNLVGKLINLWGCKSYLILRDIFPQWVVDNGLISKNSIIHYYFKYFEKVNYKHANFIGVMSGSNLNFFKENGFDIKKFEILYNWSKNIKVPKPKNKFRKQLNLINKTVLFYGGNIGYAQQIINLINLAKKFKNNTRVHFLFVGKGDEVNLLLESISKNNLNNITYLSSVNQKTYFEMLSEFDIGLFSLHSSHKTYNFPGKLLGYMSYSKPILGCVNSGNDLADIINKSKAGFVVNTLDELALYKSANRLISSVHLREEMGNNGKDLLKSKFSVSVIAKQIMDKFI